MIALFRNLKCENPKSGGRSDFLAVVELGLDTPSEPSKRLICTRSCVRKGAGFPCPIVEPAQRSKAEAS